VLTKQILFFISNKRQTEQRNELCKTHQPFHETEHNLTDSTS